METRLALDILPQPDTATCGATCLHAIYRYYGDAIALADVVRQVEHLEEGGTLAVMLGRHALARGYEVELYTYDLKIFDPTWFRPGIDLAAKLSAQARFKPNAKLRKASETYLKFLAEGGDIRFRDMSSAMIRKPLRKGHPVLTGLSSTYLYGAPREYGPQDVDDDVRGLPQGHFVVLCGYDSGTRRVLLADPFAQNPVAGKQTYEVDMDHLICAIMLGIVTYDSNFMIIKPA